MYFLEIFLDIVLPKYLLSGFGKKQSKEVKWPNPTADILVTLNLLIIKRKKIYCSLSYFHTHMHLLFPKDLVFDICTGLLTGIDFDGLDLYPFPCFVSPNIDGSLSF